MNNTFGSLVVIADELRLYRRESLLQAGLCGSRVDKNDFANWETLGKKEIECEGYDLWLATQGRNQNMLMSKQGAFSQF
ncbi:hypothetical protein KSX_78190 [Ktedonospora formicarum]|uniref:Uncharacterized protein n=1 Tax=Ktedonospora formicarum TaxID=2778364 RepID=A0A8J3I6P4_9CHLR|nr:hypothetical protein KSX_78190 [Ktedonospora formicarum]